MVNKPKSTPKVGNLSKIGHIAGAISLGIMDVLNTGTPPGFELYVYREFLSLGNLDFLVQYIKDEIEKLEKQPGLIESRILRGMQIEDRKLGDMKDYFQKLEKLRADNGGKMVGPF